MQVFTRGLSIATLPLLSCLLLLLSAELSGAGSGDLRDAAGDPVMLFVGVPTFGNFATYDGPENSRLNFQISEAGEVAYIGLSRLYQASGRPETFGQYNYRIRSAATGQVVFGPYTVNLNNENLTTYEQAAAGPAALNPGGYATGEEFTFTAPAAGVYFIEFDKNRFNSPRYIGLWDVTIANNGVEQTGRVFSKNWSFRVPEVEPDLPYCSFGAELSTVFYSYTADGFVTKIDFTDSGFQPLSFNLAFNRQGPGTSGDLASDRRSIPFVNATDNAAEHLIFLEEPDVALFPDGECGVAQVSGQLRCTGNNEFCIPVTASGEGQVDILLDFNQNGTFDEGLDRILVFAASGAGVETCVPWDGLLGNGTAPGEGTVVDINLSFAQGVQHWSLYDGELMRNGFCVTPIRPACSVTNANTPLFYDDINIVEDPGTGGPKRQLEGCECQTENCRTWTYFEANADDDCSIVDSRTEGYGDRNTLNTWWFAHASRSSQLDIPVTLTSIDGPVDHCPGESVEVTLTTNTSNEIADINWQGPAGALPQFTGQTIITVSQSGVYVATVTDDAGCESTSQYSLFDVTCSLQTTVLGVTCSDNETDTNPADDVYFVEFRVDGATSPGFLYDGEVYPYGTVVRAGPFAIADGDFELSVRDQEYSCCAETLTVPAPRPCSDGCAITGVNIINTQCDNAGTPTDPTDDTFTFTMIVNGINVGSQWVDRQVGWGGTYGTEMTFGPFPISEGTRNYYFEDVDDPDCAIAVTVQPPRTCSNVCVQTPLATNIVCGDNGTPFDPSDDVYFFDLTVTGENTPSVAYSVNGQGVYMYGATNTFGPYPIAGSDFTVELTDAGGPSCTTTFTLPETPQPCSDACGIEVVDVLLTCAPGEDGGTDALQVEVLVRNPNPFSTAWVTSSGIEGVYNEYVNIGTINPGEAVLNFTVAELERASCTATGQVTSPAIEVDCPAQMASRDYALRLQTFAGALSPQPVAQQIACLGTDQEVAFQNRTTFSLREGQNSGPELYTLYLFAPAGVEIRTAMFNQAAEETLTCENLVGEAAGAGEGRRSNVPGLPTSATPTEMELAQVLPLVLLSGQQYSLVTAAAVAVPEYRYVLLTASGSSAELRNESGAQIITDASTGAFTFNIGSVALAQLFNNIDAPLSAELPNLSSLCGAPEFAVRDSLAGTCDLARIIRTYDLTVGDTTIMGICEQEIALRTSELVDVQWPAKSYQFACDEEFPVLPSGNPAPSYTGYPFLYVDGTTLPLDGRDVDPFTYNYSDVLVELPEGGVRIERTWLVVDDCRGGDLTFVQTFLLDVDGEAFFTCPISNHYCPIVEEDIMVWGLDTGECLATLRIPEPEVNNLCDSTGWTFTTEVFTILVTGDTVLLATLVDEDDRELIDLPAGEYFLRFSGRHATETIANRDCRFRIQDVENPVAVCKSTVNLSLPGNGQIQVRASLIDQGSYDNCTLANLEIRRLTPDSSSYARGVIFDCEDVGTVQRVDLRVVDASGNENTCTSSVTIRDNSNPYCTGLSTVTVTCTDLPDGFNPYDTTQLRQLFGMPVVVDNCSAVATELAPNVAGDICAPERIRRAFRALDQHGNYSSSLFYQDIIVTSALNYGVRLPQDATVECPAEAPVAEVFGTACDSITVATEDVTTAGDDAVCRLIERRITITNWCEWDGVSAAIELDRAADCTVAAGTGNLVLVRTAEAAYLDVDSLITNASPAAGTCADNPTGYLSRLATDGTGRYTYTQFIRIVDNTAPVLSLSTSDSLCAAEGDCEAEVSLSINYGTDCEVAPGDLSISVDVDNDGTIDDLPGRLTGTFPTLSYTLDLPIGEHRFLVTATDACGNTGETAHLARVLDCSIPELFARQDRSYSLTGLQESGDVDGDGEVEEATAVVSAIDIASCNATDCSGPLTFSINRVGEDVDRTATSLILDCEDRYRVEVEVYVWDNAVNPYAVQPDGTIGGPNWERKLATIQVLDPTQACSSCQVGNALTLNGLIATPEGLPIAGVSVQALDKGRTTTGRFGTYQLPGTYGETYELRASYENDTDPRAGLSTLDMIILRRHLLDVESLEDPYLKIAADLNRDGRVTLLDLIQLQALILAKEDLYPTAGMWRFVNASWDGRNEPIEVIYLRNVTQCAVDKDFIGIRLGDLNRSLNANYYVRGEAAGAGGGG